VKLNYLLYKTYTNIIYHNKILVSNNFFGGILMKEKKLVIVLVLCLILLSACFKSGDGSPSENLKTFTNAIKDNDMHTAFNYLTDESIEGSCAIYIFIDELENDPEIQNKLENELGVSFEELKKRNDKESLALLMEKTGENPFSDEVMDYEIVTEEIDGDEAIVTIKMLSGEEIPINMVKEDGIWKLEY